MKKVNSINKILLFFLLISLMISHANASEVEVNVDANTAEIIVGTSNSLPFGNNLNLAAGGIYNDEDFAFFHAKAAISDTFLEDYLMVEMGFKGVLGKTERANPDEEAGLGAIGFYLGGDYLLSSFELLRIPFDPEIGVSITIAPEPLCFDDTNRFSEFKAYLGVGIMNNRMGKIIIGYRAIDARVEEYETWETSYTGMYFGYRFLF